MFSAPFCGNLVTLSVTMVIHGVFSGLLTVGKVFSFGHNLWDTNKIETGGKLNIFEPYFRRECFHH